LGGTSQSGISTGVLDQGTATMTLPFCWSTSRMSTGVPFIDGSLHCCSVGGVVVASTQHVTGGGS
jgi:hypothetical protein